MFKLHFWATWHWTSQKALLLTTSQNVFWHVSSIPVGVDICVCFAILHQQLQWTRRESLWWLRLSSKYFGQFNYLLTCFAMLRATHFNRVALPIKFAFIEPNEAMHFDVKCKWTWKWNMHENESEQRHKWNEKELFKQRCKETHGSWQCFWEGQFLQINCIFTSILPVSCFSL